MKRFPLFVASLLGFAFSAPAQFSSVRHGGAGGRSGGVVVSHPAGQHHGWQQRGVVRRAPAPFPDRRAHGHWETRTEQVLVPGYWEDRHVPPTYGWIYSGCGHRHWGLIDRGGCRRVWVPDRWETRTHRVWVNC